jgi:hypothetical protein
MEESELTRKSRALVEWAQGLLDADGPTPATRGWIADAMRRLGTEAFQGDEPPLASLHGAGAGATVLARAAGGPVLMLARFPSDVPTPIHNHNSWGIACVITGRDRYLRWARLDDGKDPNHARLTLAEQVELAVGDVAVFDEPPGDVHSQQGIGGPVWELVFFGHDPDRLPRAYFDPDSGSVTYANSRR